VKDAEVLEIFKKSGALLNGHFILSSGLHSAQYLQCALILQEPEYAKKVCSALAEKFKKDKPTVVIGPALGGVIVSFEVGKALGVRAIFAEREQGKMTLRRGFDIKPDDKVLVVEDVVTRFESLLNLDVQTFPPDKCPLCKSGTPATKPGSRK
jgi:orotate phosphoribosyltransferase